MGLNLKIARIKKGLSQKQLADKVGISPATVSKAETGKFDLRLSTLIKLSKVLDVSVEELIPHEE